MANYPICGYWSSVMCNCNKNKVTMYDENTKPLQDNGIADYDTIVGRLAELYLTRYACVAIICDEALDRSGRLLGVVRDKARELRTKQEGGER